MANFQKILKHSNNLQHLKESLVKKKKYTLANFKKNLLFEQNFKYNILYLKG